MFTFTVLTSHGRTAQVPSCDEAVARDHRLIAFWKDPPEHLVRVDTTRGSFSFWADELDAEHPVLLRHLGVAVCLGEEARDYDTVAAEVAAGGGISALGAIQARPEESFASAADRTRDLSGPIWQGLGRDMRIFASGYRGVGASTTYERLWDWVAPQWHGEGVQLPESSDGPIQYNFTVGRGVSSQQDIRRRLHGGVLPVLTTEIADGPLTYRATSWVGTDRPLPSEIPVSGTHYLLADGHSATHMFTEAQQAQFEKLDRAYAPNDETVFFLRIEVTNDTVAPRHAFVTLPTPYARGKYRVPHEYDPVTGYGQFADERIFAIASVDSRAASGAQVCRLVRPGQTLTVDVRIPHRPVTSERAAGIGARDVDEVHSEIVQFWRSRLATAATIQVPDQRLTEMVQAGVLHLDLIAYGEEPHGTVAPTIGIYTPIGSESAPIMQFFDSVGWNDLAARSLQYFFDKQHDDGFIQNYGGYMLETEATLWSVGEHFRYTHDAAWVERIRPSLNAAVGYILRNRERQQREGAQRHGLIIGKTADPEDPFAAYMLNGYAALGLARAAELIDDVDPAEAARWRQASLELRHDIRASLDEAIAGSPVVPLGDGTWSRTAPPWADHAGPLAIDRSGSGWQSHGTVTLRDALLGPLWLVQQEIIDPDETLTTELLEYHADLLFHDNAAFSQPYYSEHLLAHLHRGEVKQFLTPYFTQLAGLADRQTYSFWEHYFHASPHKTHEEAWFLMQTRWMLYLERGNSLRLLSGIPRVWLAAGQRISLEGVRSHFGRLDLTVQVNEDGSSVDIDLTLDPEQSPAIVSVRLPHPDGHRDICPPDDGAFTVDGETVVLSHPEARTRLRLSWN